MSFWCDKSIKGSLGIITGVNDSLEVNDNSSKYTITIPSGVYSTSYIRHTSNLIDEINKQFKGNSIPITAKLGASFGTTPYPENYSSTPTEIIGTWDKFGGNEWSLIDDKLQLTVNEAIDKIIYNPHGYNSKNYTISGVFSPTTTVSEDDDVFGIIVRYQDSSNYYKIGYEGGGLDYGDSKIRIDKVVNGNSEIIGTSTGVPVWTNGNQYNLKVEVVGNVIKVYLGDALVSTATDTTFEYGTYGYFGYSQTFAVSNINVNELNAVNEFTDIRRNVLVLDHHEETNEIISIGGNASPFFKL